MLALTAIQDNFTVSTSSDIWCRFYGLVIVAPISVNETNVVCQAPPSAFCDIKHLILNRFINENYYQC